MNSMAANNEGQTVHSWGEVGFKTKEGVYVKPSGSHDDKDMPSMTMKCEKYDFPLSMRLKALVQRCSTH